MATAKQAPKVLQPLPVEAPKGPSIEYIGEGARAVKFTINPKALRYVVRADGQVLEYL